MSLAVILGSSRGLGLNLARGHLLRSSLNVVCTSRTPDEAREAILKDLPSDAKDRLTTLKADVTKEASFEELAGQIKEMGEIRSLWNVAGILRPEKNLAQVGYDEMLRQFQINTFAPLLAMKHLVPLLPKQISRGGERKPGAPAGTDSASDVAPNGLALIASLSARVGSIEDNGRGGWYSYRASKAAQNQITRTLARELTLRKVPAISIGLHPGTVRSELSKEFTGGPGGKDGKAPGPGEFEAPDAAENLLNVVRGLTVEDSGGFRDWEGKKVPF
ncbi:Predicted short chain-type dehydrogenase [Ceraceosorus bombacis]|uniref:Predicted short chain-type dehydrogenase n=1 Tax=Ceraceosorus bombacis TaxID=401625 RepID=A0A0P1BMC8_9BASI|nr:Predicted short chain-type dehydrogenase [Ceraceosorus bombacis]